MVPAITLLGNFVGVFGGLLIATTVLELSSNAFLEHAQDADGRDVSWLWDVRFEDLGSTAHTYGASGIRAADMALRLKYAGVDAWCDPDLRGALDRVVDAAEPGELVHVVPTYTAMLSLLDLLLPGTARSEAWS